MYRLLVERLCSDVEYDAAEFGIRRDSLHCGPGQQLHLLYTGPAHIPPLLPLLGNSHVAAGGDAVHGFDDLAPPNVCFEEAEEKAKERRNKSRERESVNFLVPLVRLLNEQVRSDEHTR